MDKDKKIPKSYSVDPIVAAWLANQAAKRTIESKGAKTPSVSEIVNEILTQAMQEEVANQDVTHLRKMTRRQILKQK